MPLLKYVGPHDEVYVRDAGVYAKRNGEPVDIPEPIAASLLEQETFVAPRRPSRPRRPPSREDGGLTRGYA
jgi:hypothetical protein